MASNRAPSLRSPSAVARALQSASFQSATSDTSADSVLSWWNDGKGGGSRLDIISGSISSVDKHGGRTGGGGHSSGGSFRSASYKLRAALAREDEDDMSSSKLQRTKLRSNITRTLKMQSALSCKRQTKSLLSCAAFVPHWICL